MGSESILMAKIGIGLVVIELVGLLFGFFLGTGSASIPALNQLNTTEANLNTQAGNIGGSLNVNPLQPVSTSGTFGIIGVVLNTVLGLIDDFLKILAFLIAILVFVAEGIGAVAFLLFIFVPSLIGIIQLGIFTSIFLLIYGVILLILAFYAFESLLYIVGRIWGGTN